MPALVILAVVAVVLFNCMGSSRQAPAERDRAVAVSVWFVMPEHASQGLDAPASRIGDAVGVQACEAAAREHARTLKLPPSSGWNYYCCTREDGSDCRRRIR